MGDKKRLQLPSYTQPTGKGQDTRGEPSCNWLSRATRTRSTAAGTSLRLLNTACFSQVPHIDKKFNKDRSASPPYCLAAVTTLGLDYGQLLATRTP